MMFSMFQTSGSLLLFCGTDLKNLHNYGKKKSEQSESFQNEKYSTEHCLMNASL